MFETVLQRVKDKSINFQTKFPLCFLTDKEHPVWKCFNTQDEDSNKVVCKMCSSEMDIIVDNKNQSTKLRVHLQVNHTLEWIDLYTEWYIANEQKPKNVNEQIPEQPINFKNSTYGKSKNVKKLKLRKPKWIEFKHKTNTKNTKNLSLVWQYYDPCEQDPKRYKCKICDKTISIGSLLLKNKSLGALQRHLQIKHRSKWAKIQKRGKRQKDEMKLEMPSESYKKQNSDDEETEIGFKCEICEKEGIFKSFTRSYNLKHHIDKHHPKKTENAFKCEICEKQGIDKRYTSNQNLKFHIEKRHDINPKENEKTENAFRCEICEKQGIDKSYTSKQNLKFHIEKHHPKEDEKIENGYKCEICEKRGIFKAYTQQHNLNKHIKKHHTVGPVVSVGPDIETDEELILDGSGINDQMLRQKATERWAHLADPDHSEKEESQPCIYDPYAKIYCLICVNQGPLGKSTHA